MLTVCVGPRPGFVARGDARGHGPQKGKWTLVVVDGLVSVFPSFWGALSSHVSPSESVSTGGYKRVGLHHKWITVYRVRVGLHP